MRVVVIIQARVGSSRLPGKVLLPIGDRSMLAHVVGRCRRARAVDDVWIATTEEPADDALCAAAAALVAPLVRGPTDDVLARYALAATASRADVVVRVTADCPLLDPGEIDRLVEIYRAGVAAGQPPDWVSNQLGDRRRIPRGLDVEVVPATSLRRAAAAATDPAEREHVTPWFYRDGLRSRLVVSDPPGADHSDLRLTVDTAEDLALVRAIVARLGEGATLAATAALLAAEPALRALNQGVAQKQVASAAAARAQRVAGRLLLGRADASSAIGVGHVGRVSTLLEAWREAGGEALLLGDGVVGALAQRLRAGGVAVEAAPPPLADGAALVERARAVGAAALVVDSYALSAATVTELAAALPVLAIDDVGEALRDADLVVHPGSVNAAQRLFAGARGRVLAGPPYLLVRAEVRAVAAERAAPSPNPGAAGADSATAQPAATVAVTLGGADVGGLSAPIVAALLRGGAGADGGRRIGTIDAIAGPLAPAATLTSLQSLAPLAVARRIALRVHADVAAMAPLLARADVAISAAGSTAWELAALGVPTVLVVVADNQLGVAATVAGAGAAVVVDARAWLAAGADREGAAQAVEAAVAQLLGDAASAGVGTLAAMARAGRSLVDGHGPARVVDALLDVLEARESSAAGRQR